VRIQKISTNFGKRYLVLDEILSARKGETNKNQTRDFLRAQFGLLILSKVYFVILTFFSTVLLRLGSRSAPAQQLTGFLFFYFMISFFWCFLLVVILEGGKVLKLR
jgi:hypothetical protein